MIPRWRYDRLNLLGIGISALVLLFQRNFIFCLSLNDEGLALMKFRERVMKDPFGALSDWNSNGEDRDPNLRNLCLEGTLAPELGKLTSMKSIILRNNSFSGVIPKEMGQLRELEVLDLGYNNFSGPFPSDLGNNLSLSILLLDNNKLLGNISPEIYELKMLSEFQVDEKQLASDAPKPTCDCISDSWDDALHGSKIYRRLQQQFPASHSPTKHRKESKLTPSPARSPSSSSSSSFAPSPNSPSMSPSGLPFPSPSFPPTSPSPESPVPSPSALASPTPSPLPAVPPHETSSPSASPPNVAAEPSSHDASAPSSASVPNIVSKKASHKVIIWCSVVGGSLFLIITAIGIILYQGNKVVPVRPWATGLSGQLQKAFITVKLEHSVGSNTELTPFHPMEIARVPSLKRSELEVACEDFSNVIGTLGDVTVYKGTLSSGVEIAVPSIGMTSSDEWSKSLETQFRNKIETLSKVNHKNFVNLIGFCEEEEPFTRMMVFEYAPNGTLFEHLHIKESEHLDWGMRVRIAMGMAYCLEYMHQMTPPTAHKNLRSSSVYLTEDYAAKISDFSFWTQLNAVNVGLAKKELLENQSADPKSNVYSFGTILLEMITGRLPYSVDNGSLTHWASNLLSTDKPLSEIVDPTLESFSEEELKKLLEVVKECMSPDPGERPMMRDITAKLKEITALGPDGATPKSSPLWWAELEIMSTGTS
ncbi:Serine-threonine/tyrosine-protein kinase, catalytic domain [Dillenia turbinata]|uniref:Serine-threonine/tyrosine-protein kinase, catalytic domain n=1 Tax=Dillenia turbinata TaxID=194707 RepID=A0AAN8VPW6_9MAGN